MKSGAIELRILSPDDGDGLIHFQFSASNGLFSAAQEFYEYNDFLLPFGQSLEAFPAKAGDVPLLEIGSMEERSAYYCRLRAYIFDAVGHAALEVIADNRREGEYLARAAFQIHCEIAAINRLGSEILRWSTDTEIPLLWKALDNSL